MVDTIQILLTVVITVLTVLLVAIGVQIFFVLDKLRNILKKTDSIFEDASRISHAVVEPVEEASTFISGLKSGVGMIKAFKKLFSADEYQDEQ